MRSWKQTERQQLLMESSLAYPRGKEEKSRNSKGGKNSKVEQTLGYLGVVKPVTPKEDVPLRGICILKMTKLSVAIFQQPGHHDHLT
ncbi:hypothetical protein AVEN_21021-1 [Araneus ventricosus]|uniref:Uncharacterized protein n=1 Tax=Araneus ventricosus TaxID=182803 RepID=A0A4Y2D7Z5_ARAVE|nr:hypothetical protein AVEN_21021-1 [Araneus ventricosus]